MSNTFTFTPTSGYDIGRGYDVTITWESGFTFLGNYTFQYYNGNSWQTLGPATSDTVTQLSASIPAASFPDTADTYTVRLIGNSTYTSSQDLVVDPVTFTFTTSPSSLTEYEAGDLTATIVSSNDYTKWPSTFAYDLQYFDATSTWTRLKLNTGTGGDESLTFNIDAGNMPAAGSWQIKLIQKSGGTTITEYYVDEGTLLTVSTPILCFGAGSLILTAFGQVPVENLVVGESLVKTVSESYRRVTAMKSMTMRNDCSKGGKSRLYVCDSEGYSDAGMTVSDGQLILTGAHSVLVSSLTETEREGIIANLGEVFVTEGHYRLPVFLDVRAKPYNVDGEFTVYHFALEDKWEHANHGVYANGLLVESASNWHLRNGDGDGDGDGDIN